MRLLAPLNPPPPAWPDARVWVIGASYGIGAATAQALLAAGARVALSARSADKLAAVASGHPRAVVAPLDFTQGADVADVWNRIRPNGAAATSRSSSPEPTRKSGHGN